MTADPAFATVAELGAAYRSGSLAMIEVVERHLARIEALDGRLNAFIHVAADHARREAERLATELRDGHDCGPLHGVPVAIKDIIDVAGMPTTLGTGGHDGRPAEADAALVARLRRAGAIVIGKTNTYEFAYAAYNEAFGYTRNPWDPSRTAGATSGGSAAAVAAGLATVAVGTDAGGSVRIPAAFCGIVGFKVTHGAIDLAGAFPSSWTLDHGGAMGRSVVCVAVLAAAMAGRSHTLGAARSLAGRRFGVVAELARHDCVSADMRAAFADAVDRMRAAGARIDDVALPGVLGGTDAMMAILYPEIAVIHETRLAERQDDYSPGTVAEVEPGFAALAADYVRALRFRDRLAARIAALLDERRLDALLSPTAPWVAPARIDAPNDEAMMLEGIAAAPFSVAGVPAISLWCGSDADGLPCGMEVVSRRGDDARLLSLAAAIERLLGRPDLPSSIAA